MDKSDHISNSNSDEKKKVAGDAPPTGLALDRYISTSGQEMRMAEPVAPQAKGIARECLSGWRGKFVNFTTCFHRCSRSRCETTTGQPEVQGASGASQSTGAPYSATDEAQLVIFVSYGSRSKKAKLSFEFTYLKSTGLNFWSQSLKKTNESRQMF